MLSLSDAFHNPGCTPLSPPTQAQAPFFPFAQTLTWTPSPLSQGAMETHTSQDLVSRDGCKLWRGLQSLGLQGL